MRILSIVGNVDKRIIALPLVRAFRLVGKTVLITDNTEYIRLLDSGESFGDSYGIGIYRKEKLDGSEIDYVDAEISEEIKNIVYVSNTYIHPKSDHVVVVSGIDKSFFGDAVQKAINSEEYKDKLTEVMLAVDKNKKGLKTIDDGRIILSPSDFEWLWKCEEVKELMPYTGKSLSKILGQIGAKALGIEEGTAEKLLSRDKYEASGKK